MADPKVARTVRVAASIEAEIEKYADESGISFSAAISVLAREALNARKNTTIGPPPTAIGGGGGYTGGARHSATTDAQGG
jgi:hypothetical protein